MTYPNAMSLMLLLMLGTMPRAGAGEAVSVDVAGPLAGFARMIGGAWQVTFDSGTRQVDTWTWGPGRHSLRVDTTGAGAGGEPWRAVEVVYWDPGWQQVRLFGLSPYAQGVMDGWIRLDGERARAVFTLDQPGRQRSMSRDWTFRGPDEYRSELWDGADAAIVPPQPWNYAGLRENPGSGAPLPLAEWTYIRSNAPPAAGPDNGHPAPAVSAALSALAALPGRRWQAKGEWTDDAAFAMEVTFEWIPHAGFIHGRATRLTDAGEPVHLIDAYIYHHPGSGQLRCFALSAWNVIYEGELTTLEGNAAQLDVTGRTSDHEASHRVRFDFDTDGILHHRVLGAED